MVRTLLLRGMVVGVVAAVLAFGFSAWFGTPEVERAIAQEERRVGDADAGAAVSVVSRPVQRTAGLAAGFVLYGVAIGGLIALAFAVLSGRLGSLDARGVAALVTVGGFAAVVLVPFLKYPANPPGVSDPDTLNQRTGLYLGLLVVAVVALVLAVQLGRQLAPRFGGWNAVVIAGVVFVLTVFAVQLAFPSIDEVAPDFPATLLWCFRLASLGTQLVLWAAIGLLFGHLTERAQRQRAAAPTTARA